ncbi:MAG: gamma-glutamyltransferase family protein [Gammaproteobacteria bacterium]|nr:gamma-glutamyltransferase family protein [Gammaproteobacteria bacterium]MDH4254400.1 gamma-glutamyltransferase family protein [Gammaproteobacteria bacterium]MDH5309333.1 gamma-glutamyltransferase family protein [Gammaproteobacteria bacterium]
MSRSQQVAVATTSELAAQAAAEVAVAGGNAVDCAVAAAMVSINTQPGVCALAGGGYATVWHPDEEPVTIDGYVALPGQGGARRTTEGVNVHLGYGGGVDTVVGCASVGVPGTLAALEHTWRRWGRVAWADVLAPSIRAAEDGFPLAQACRYYLQYSAEPVFGRSGDGFRALHDEHGRLHETGALIRVPRLADSLRIIAEGGAYEFYEGQLAQRIAAHVREGGGALSLADLAGYRAIERPALTLQLGGYTVATNPPPAVGGAVLGAMLFDFVRHPAHGRDRETLRRLLRAQAVVLDYRDQNVDASEDVGKAAAEMLDLARASGLPSGRASASTVHTSACDSNGLACAITASSGYGSGEMPDGTGLWLNNCLGELELNRHGLDAGPAGARLPSNMAPGVARRGAAVLAFGTPGADRITTALQQFLINYVQLGMSLDDAIAAPRMHYEARENPPRVAVEPGVDIGDVGIEVVRFPATSMYFGGVGATSHAPATGLEAAADPRREGGIFKGR